MSNNSCVSKFCFQDPKLINVCFQPPKFFRPLHNYYVLNDIKLAVLGRHFMVKLQTDNTSAYTSTLYYNPQNISTVHITQKLK